MQKIKHIVHLFFFILAVVLVSEVSAAKISGIATYDGKVPNFKPIKMEADPVCLTKHSGEVLPQTLVLGDEETKTMGNVFVHITGGLSNNNYPSPSEPVIFTQEGCLYSPHVLAVMAGQPIKILNPDGILHNVHALPKVNEEFNLAMPKFREETTKVFDKVEITPFPIKCDVHPWMGAWISVLDHPFFCVTKPEGKYSIDNLPAGTYEIEAWHEKLAAQKATVTLAEGESKEINFTFSRP